MLTHSTCMYDSACHTTVLCCSHGALASLPDLYRDGLMRLVNACQATSHKEYIVPATRIQTEYCYKGELTFQFEIRLFFLTNDKT